MLRLIKRLPQYITAKWFNAPVPLPANFTLGLTYRCNSRCATCRIYERENKELSPENWKVIFKSLGKSPYWVTFTGGEPFLYRDIVEVYHYLTDICHPVMVNIPTNGLAYDRILDAVWQMIHLSPLTKLTINVSLDHYKEADNDEIRGVKGYFRQALETIESLQQHTDSNFSVGIHTVISRFNVADLNDIAVNLSRLLKKPEHYIMEIAERRHELRTMDLDITPSKDQYQKALEGIKHLPSRRSIIQAFRSDYYDKILRWYDGNCISCYAGYVSCQITPEGNVVPCCIKYENMGNLQAFNFDFPKLWNGIMARAIRENVKACKGCPMANANYTNSLFNPRTIWNVGMNRLGIASK